MIERHEIIQRVFGDDNRFGVPSGPALVYCYRRFGFTPYGSDDHKRVCRYVVPTAVDGLCVTLLFGGKTCYIHDSMCQEVMARYYGEEQRPWWDWWRLCGEWAAEQGTFLYADGLADAELYKSQAEEWLAEQGVVGEVSADEWEKEWSDKYFSHIQSHNDQVRDAFKQVEPFPENQIPGAFMQQCQDAFEASLRDLLRPVQVRDVFINILGVCDKETFTKVVEPSFMAGYGVVTDVYKNYDLYLEYLNLAYDTGVGDLFVGMNLVLNKLRAGDQ